MQVPIPEVGHYKPLLFLLLLVLPAPVTVCRHAWFVPFACGKAAHPTRPTTQAHSSGVIHMQRRAAGAPFAKVLSGGSDCILPPLHATTAPHNHCHHVRGSSSSRLTSATRYALNAVTSDPCARTVWPRFLLEKADTRHRSQLPPQCVLADVL